MDDEAMHAQPAHEAEQNPSFGAPLAPLREVRLLNAFVHDVTMDQVVEHFERGVMLTLHVDMMIKLRKDREFHDLLRRFDLVTCDSQIMYFALKFLGTPVSERVSGSDFFPRFYQRHRDDPEMTVFMLGGKPGIADIAAERINAKVGREFVCGTYAPSFDFEDRPDEIEHMLDLVNSSGAKALLVGLGGGRQEKFIFRYRDRLPDVKLFLPLGGTIDYEAGTLQRPAPWVTGMGLEWFYRLVKEPRQRWRRYLLQDPPFLFDVLKQKLGLYRDPLNKG
ncbi:MAG: WecB/TagA/CpsF family glycosyltransferase [Pseudomonadota bacterium]